MKAHAIVPIGVTVVVTLLILVGCGRPRAQTTPLGQVSATDTPATTLVATDTAVAAVTPQPTHPTGPTDPAVATTTGGTPLPSPSTTALAATTSPLGAARPAVATAPPAVATPSAVAPTTVSAPAAPPLTVQTLDCVASSPACSQITIQGDPLAELGGKPSPFRGNADPTIRKDPLSNRLWMSYSWPLVHNVSQGVNVPAVDIHLAFSDDGGKTWHYQGPLWPSYADTDKGGKGETGYTAFEVGNLLPRVIGSGVTWYGIRGAYFVPEKGGYSARPTNSLRFVMSQASSPEGLATAPSATLGMGFTSPAWGIDTKLAALSPDVSDCNLLNEPGLYFQGDTLYLVLDCVRPRPQADGARESVVVVSTKPEGDIHAWKWQYLGQLVGAAEERELGGNSLTQVDLSLGKDGQLLLVGSPGTLGTGSDNHIGCKVIEVASLNPPQLARDTTGKLRVRAFASASDLGAHGPGACAYDPASATGLIIVRRQGELTFSLNATGLNP